MWHKCGTQKGPHTFFDHLHTPYLPQCPKVGHFWYRCPKCPKWGTKWGAKWGMHLNCHPSQSLIMHLIAPHTPQCTSILNPQFSILIVPQKWGTFKFVPQVPQMGYKWGTQKGPHTFFRFVPQKWGTFILVPQAPQMRHMWGTQRGAHTFFYLLKLDGHHWESSPFWVPKFVGALKVVPKLVASD